MDAATVAVSCKVNGICTVGNILFFIFLFYQIFPRWTVMFYTDCGLSNRQTLLQS